MAETKKVEINIIFFKILLLLLSASLFFVCFTVKSQGAILAFLSAAVLSASGGMFWSPLVWNKVSDKAKKLVGISLVFATALVSVIIGIFFLYTETDIGLAVGIFVIAGLCAVMWVRLIMMLLKGWSD